MYHFKTLLSIFILIIFFSIFSNELSAQNTVGIMSINTEWFWDYSEPHEGIAIGPRGIPPTKMEVGLEAFAIAQFIMVNDADIVGLIEVENQDVVDSIKYFLPENEWNVVFIKGRDNITGQDVALLTRFEEINGTATNYEDEYGEKKPSKVLGVGLNVNGSTMFVIVTHLLSQRGDNDEKRLKQADFIRQQVINSQSNFDHIVILGDLNDFPDSPPLRRLRGFDDSEFNFIQTAVTTGDNPAYSYVYNDEKQLIDHILLSPSLQTAFNTLSIDQRHRSIDLGPISDHWAVIVNIELN